VAAFDGERRIASGKFGVCLAVAPALTPYLGTPPGLQGSHVTRSSPVSSSRSTTRLLTSWAAKQGSSQGALATASAATSSTGTVADRDDPISRQPGQRVTVTPDDTGRDPVVGELVASGVDEITIKRNDPAVGEVSVHFPRAGFAVTLA
jgi:hypothetical protein